VPKWRYRTLLDAQKAPRPGASVAMVVQTISCVDMVLLVRDADDDFAQLAGAWIVHCGTEQQVRTDLALIAHRLEEVGWCRPDKAWIDYVIQEACIVPAFIQKVEVSPN
jgi:hypothetical protein